MSISTKKGDTGYTSLLRGQRVPKYHLATEAVGTLDEANSHLGLARAVSGDRPVKRILLQVQKHIFIISSELSVPKGQGTPPRKRMSGADIQWLERLIQDFEEALALPPGFVAFGQEVSSSHLDVARTVIRKAERTAVKMKDEGMLENVFILKYLNRMSDLLFVLACYEEKGEEDRRKLGKLLSFPHHARPAYRRMAVLSSIVILSLLAAIALLLLYHDPSSDAPRDAVSTHMQDMETMHGTVGR